ncbi:kinesin-like protein KIF23 isoform X1 [Acropora millepora]|uniref:kinesin-like protein KIF23 isoform X1 n=1 Tax=Acropora millepora TaxID=45264 RepID=UPI001CF44D9F|nr:kinesin-like protein KIF23 isoform X1 [Acropora millepora]
MKSVPKTPVSSKTPRSTKTPRRTASNKLKDPVEVYCRIRPLGNNEEESCVQIVSDTILQLTAPKNSAGYKSGHRLETQHTFKKVYDEKTTQKVLFDSVAYPVVDDLIRGKNGLIFTYGITGSGKTHTMTGSPSDSGLLPRCLDVIFNSIGELQAARYVFKPDKANGIDIQNEHEAKLEKEKREREAALQALPPTAGSRNRNADNEFSDLIRVPETGIVNEVDEDNSYAVFVSYFEIYNNYIYDLLDETPVDPICAKPPASKNLREDNNRNMYVSGVTEVEVKSTEEAYGVFWKGQKKRRVANTVLNRESSRSHSVFAVKLVQGPLDPDGEEVLQDKDQLAVSTLSLCDLAGSERTNRTKAGGDRLREAGNINASLMTLRTCMEMLRENQGSIENGMAPKIVPYRDSKLTHLFKNFFDGEGKVRMVVCLNPNSDDYDESVHVMKFAEVTQDVVIARPQAIRFDTGLTPGRRRANQMYKDALANFEENGEDIREKVIIAKPLHTMGPPFPFFELTSPEDNTTLINLLHFLQERQRRRQTLIDDLSRREGIFRAHLLELEKENSQSATVIASLKSTIEEKDRDIQKLERRLKALTQKNEMLQKTAELYESDKKELQYELDDQKKRADKEKNDKVKMRHALKGVVSQEKGKWERECSKRVKDKEIEMQAKMWQKDEKLRQLKEIVQNMKTNEKPLTRAQAKSAALTRSKSPPPVARKPPAKARHHRRSKSSDCWIEHKPATHMETDTVLQPSLKNKKTVSRPEGKDFKDTNATNYVLAHQEEDSGGEIQTKMIKGEVYKTASGGHSIQFTEVETLKTRSDQLSSPGRKRRGSDSADDDSRSSWTDIETRCSTAIEGRPGLDPSYCHTASKKKRP